MIWVSVKPWPWFPSYSPRRLKERREMRKRRRKSWRSGFLKMVSWKICVWSHPNPKQKHDFFLIFAVHMIRCAEVNCLDFLSLCVTVDSSLVISQSTLIICPASLVHHWKREIDRHVKASKLTVCLYHGPNRERSARVWEPWPNSHFFNYFFNF